VPLVAIPYIFHLHSLGGSDIRQSNQLDLPDLVSYVLQPDAPFRRVNSFVTYKP
jgi:hypothetical protein